MNINQKMTKKKEDLKQTKMKREQKLLIITYDYRVFFALIVSNQAKQKVLLTINPFKVHKQNN